MSKILLGGGRAGYVVLPFTVMVPINARDVPFEIIPSGVPSFQDDGTNNYSPDVLFVPSRGKMILLETFSD